MTLAPTIILAFCLAFWIFQIVRTIQFILCREEQISMFRLDISLLKSQLCVHQAFRFHGSESERAFLKAQDEILFGFYESSRKILEESNEKTLSLRLMYDPIGISIRKRKDLIELEAKCIDDNTDLLKQLNQYFKETLQDQEEENNDDGDGNNESSSPTKTTAIH